MHNKDKPHPLKAALAALSGSLSSNTVMSKNSDPFRLDIPTNRRNGEWLQDIMSELRIPKRGKKIHSRGIHYAAQDKKIPMPAPDITFTPPKKKGGRPVALGPVYLNTDAHSQWMESIIGPARWLGYVNWDDIRDAHSGEPVIRIHQPSVPKGWARTYDGLLVPDHDDLIPEAVLDDFEGEQLYHVMLIGEKLSLEDILLPISEHHSTDLFLGKGDLTDTMVWEIANAAAADPRPARMLYFADCDPPGYNMARVLTWKLIALQLVHPELQFDWKIHRIALTPDQVREHKLPEAPLKDGEKRAVNWLAKKGVEQTEIDSIATNQPEVLEQIAEDAVSALHDPTLTTRVTAAKRRWERRAQAAIEEQTSDELRERRREVAELIEQKRAEIQELIDSVQTDYDLPDEPAVPQARVSPDGDPGELVCDSSWSFAEKCRRLVAQKTYDE